ncbi:MAG: HAD family hydrolase [Chloroflexota bacterium]
MPDLSNQRLPQLVFLLDVDNTLLDNDGVKGDLERQMAGFLSPGDRQRFWELYEAVRHEVDVVDFPLTLRRFRQGEHDPAVVEKLVTLLDGYRFDQHLYPFALETIEHLRTLGVVAIVSDGDPDFQPRKIAEAGLAEAVGGNVMIYTHKERSIAEVMRRFPADRYVMVDDKPRILATLKREHGDRFTTVHILQGHYARIDADLMPAPDIELASIGELRGFTGAELLGTMADHPLPAGDLHDA